MKTIELEKWAPSKEDPLRLEHTGQPIAAEVFEELKYRLESMGYLPDEYFLLNSPWDDGREVPDGADISCETDYGGNEGVYIDVYLCWFDKEQNRKRAERFITGKTLGENGNDLDRMFLISSAITKAFHGDNAAHTRYTPDGGPEDTGGSVIHLSQEEEQVIVRALIAQHERQANVMSQTEQLLRRMTGSITAYMDLMGQQPLHLSEYDRASLAIRDGELDTFKSMLDHVPDQKDRDALLIEAAGRPGEVGRKMTVLLLAEQDGFPGAAYQTACEKAVETSDPEKIAFLVEQADSYAKDLPPDFYGHIAYQAYNSERGYMARPIIQACNREQVAAMSNDVFCRAVKAEDYRFAQELVGKGYEMTDGLAQLIIYTQDRSSWVIDHLLGKGIRIDPEDYASLNASIRRGFTNVGKTLLDLGIDFEKFRERLPEDSELTETETFKALAQYWTEQHLPEPVQEQSM